VVVLSTYLQENHGRLKIASVPALNSDILRVLFSKHLKPLGLKSNRNEAYHTLPISLGV
jgi:hypothetical protein